MKPEFTPLRNAISRFIKLDDAEWELLEPGLEIKHYKKGANFATEGKRANEVGLLLEGNMRHYYTRDGEEKTTYFYFEGHFVSAYISCITHAPSLMTIEALTDCTIIEFSYSLLAGLFERSHIWAQFGRLIAEYLAIGLEERMAGLLMQSPEERYLELITGNKQKIIERIPQHYIASYLGITPVSLSRMRARLMKK